MNFFTMFKYPWNMFDYYSRFIRLGRWSKNKLYVLYMYLYFGHVIYSIIYRSNGGALTKYCREWPWQIYHKRNTRLILKITSCMKKLVKVWVQLFTELSASHFMRLFPSKFWTWRSIIMTWYVVFLFSPAIE